VIDGWSEKIKRIKGFDAKLAASIYGGELAQVAELVGLIRKELNKY
jgi:hypothetical protein